MKHIITEIDGTAVRVLYADKAADPSSWVDIKLPIEALQSPSDESKPLGDIQKRYLAEIRLSALLAAREIADAEIADLYKMKGR